MSKINDILLEAKDKLLALHDAPVDLTGKVVICYGEDDLFDAVKGVKNYPVVGIVYEGMRSEPEAGPTAKIGLSSEATIALILVEQGDALHRTAQKESRAIDYLDAMRGQFMGKISTVTRHHWHFQVEAPAELRAGMVCWIQRWTLPIQLPPSS